MNARVPCLDPFAALHEAQRAAVDHGRGREGAGALLVIAGAGTGKTTTLAARVARLLRDGADPQRLLLLTFSRRAADEMVRRVDALVARALHRPAEAHARVLPWAGTFHSVGARLLQRHAQALGLPVPFTVHDRAEAEDLMGWVRQRRQLGTGARRAPTRATCLALYSRVVNTQRPLAEVVRTDFPWHLGWEDELATLMRDYVREKQRQRVLDYDDLLLWWAQALDHPQTGPALRGAFDHVLVDEVQDCNALQAALLRGLKPDGRGLTVVGDDAQAIYGFRGADPRFILDFPNLFDPPAHVVTLELSHRATAPLLAASNAVIAQAAERHPKQLRSARAAEPRPAALPQCVHVDDEGAQAQWVADQVLRHREQGLALKRQAVLFRTSHHSTALEMELARRDIPFAKFGGLRFLETAHVRDWLAVLRWVDNPRSRLAGLRVVGLLPGLGPAHAARLLDALETADDPEQTLSAFRVPGPAQHEWGAWLRTRSALRSAPWPQDLHLAIAWLGPLLRQRHEDAGLRIADLERLALLGERHGSRQRFVTELLLDPPESTSDEAGAPHLDEDWLVLSTIHAAKGREWPAVFVLNVVDGCIPSDMAAGSPETLEEERRLLYVAMTRARDHLHLMLPLRFHATEQPRWGDRHCTAGPSRFLPWNAAALFETVRPSAHDAAAAATTSALAGVEAPWRPDAMAPPPAEPAPAFPGALPSRLQGLF